MLGEDRLGRRGALRVDRGSRNAGQDHDVALAAELVDQPLSGDPAGLVLIDVRVVGARLGDLGVIGENDNALVAGVLHHLVQRGRRDRIDHDRFRALLDHRVDLLDLPLRVRPATCTVRSTLSRSVL